MATSTTSSVPVGSTGAGGGNTLRITGLNTGLDIDAMVKKMLIADQSKVDQAKQAQQLIKWKQEAYQSIITDVKDLQSTYFDITNSENYLMSSNSYNNMTATSSSESTVGAKASSNVTAGTYKILVSQLAKGATIIGESKLEITTGEHIGDDVTDSTTLKELGITNTDGKVSFKVSYGSNGSTTSEKTINVNESSTIGELVNAIKNETEGAVTAKFDELTGKFSIQTTTTGLGSTLKIEDTNNALSNLKISESDKNVNKNGQDALVAIKEPGSDKYVTSTQSSNNFTVNGMSYIISDINSTVDITGSGIEVDANSTDSPVSISVTQDTSKVHDLISSFIDKYNNLVGEIQDKLNEKKDYDYKPLTDSQKEEMSDTDITNWENKAKQGILRNDDNLQQLLNDLTSAFNTPVVDSSGKSISSFYFGSIGSNALGIDTSDDYSQGAKLSITDDQQFTDIITNHIDDIMKLFTTTSDSKDTATKFNESGIFERINHIINNNVGVIGTTLNSGTLTKYANLQDDYSVTGGSGTGTLPDQIYQKQLLINTLTERMNADQTKYYNQFTQLEVAMEQLNAQQSTLSLYLG